MCGGVARGQYDLRAIKNTLADLFPHGEFLLSAANENDTYTDIQVRLLALADAGRESRTWPGGAGLRAVARTLAVPARTSHVTWASVYTTRRSARIWRRR